MSIELKKVIIVGGGLLGRTLASKLAYDGFEVAVIESDQGRSRDLREEVDVEVLCGNGASGFAAAHGRVENAGLVVASTDSDEVNLTVGFIATHVFHVECVVVRVRNEDYEEGFLGRDCEDSGEDTRV